MYASIWTDETPITWLASSHSTSQRAITGNMLLMYHSSSRSTRCGLRCNARFAYPSSITVFRSHKMRCARADFWKFVTDWYSMKKTASSVWIAQSQRSGDRSRAFRAPMGKFSSLFSGWRSRSTSSMMSVLCLNVRSVDTKIRTSHSTDGLSLSAGSLSPYIFSMSLSSRLFSVCGVHMTTPRWRRAHSSFS
eukprot:6289961-Prymnesium_polylepis.1